MFKRYLLRYFKGQRADIQDCLAMKQSEDDYPYGSPPVGDGAHVQAIIDAQRLSNSIRVLFRTG